MVNLHCLAEFTCVISSADKLPVMQYRFTPAQKQLLDLCLGRFDELRCEFLVEPQ